MEILHQFLIAQPFIALFAMIFSGLLLGKIKVKGITLGSSGVLFTALLAGHLGYQIPANIGTLGLVLFVYCIGIGAGNRFFASLLREGATLATLALVIVLVGGLVTWTGAQLLNLPAELATGIFAGALTSTPALAAASEGLTATGPDNVSIGYGIAYPFGVIGVVLFVQLLPRILKIDLDSIADNTADSNDPIENALVEIDNPALFGKKISDPGITHFNACQISRIFKSDHLVPLQYNDTFEQNQILLLVGRSGAIADAITILGKRSDRRILKDVENERRHLIATAATFIGKTLGSTTPLRNHGVVITRITRHGLTFVPNAETIIERNDQFTCVGRADDLEKFAAAIGHRSNMLDATDLLSLSAGLALGILLGLLPIGFPGGNSVRLGWAGGPLFAGLLLGHFGKIGRIVGHIPRPTRMLLQELGLVFFLANAGVRGGGTLLDTLQQHGFSLFGLGVSVSILPLIVAWPIATRLLKMNPLQALGGICGGMTSTPALGAITEKTNAQTPITSYVSAYPVALIVMIIAAKSLIKLIG